MAQVTIDPEIEDEAWGLEIGFQYNEADIDGRADRMVYQLTGE